jgi:hypothetical protein
MFSCAAFLRLRFIQHPAIDPQPSLQLLHEIASKRGNSRAFKAHFIFPGIAGAMFGLPQGSRRIIAQ